MQFRRTIIGAVLAGGIGAVALAGAGSAYAEGLDSQPHGSTTINTAKNSFNTSTSTTTNTTDSFNTLASNNTDNSFRVNVNTEVKTNVNALSGNFSGNTFVAAFSLFTVNNYNYG